MNLHKNKTDQVLNYIVRYHLKKISYLNTDLFEFVFRILNSLKFFLKIFFLKMKWITLKFTKPLIHEIRRLQHSFKI